VQMMQIQTAQIQSVQIQTAHLQLVQMMMRAAAQREELTTEWERMVAVDVV